jgi:hypothetical protein
MKIEVEIDDATLNALASRIVKESFGTDYDRSNPGRKLVEQAATRAIEAIDFAPLIQAKLPAIIGSTLDEVLVKLIRERVKVVAKRLDERGLLFREASNHE